MSRRCVLVSVNRGGESRDEKARRRLKFDTCYAGIITLNISYVCVVDQRRHTNYQLLAFAVCAHTTAAMVAR